MLTLSCVIYTVRQLRLEPVSIGITQGWSIPGSVHPHGALTFTSPVQLAPLATTNTDWYMLVRLARKMHILAMRFDTPPKRGG
eukprot:992087-Amphidinium_carterae.2